MRQIRRGMLFHRNDDKSLGEMRTSQLITSYGCGAIVDFPNETVILASADVWPKLSGGNDPRIIHCHNLETLLGKKYFVRPRYNDKPRAIYSDEYSHDIPAYRFPTMLYCPQCMRLIPEKRLSYQQEGPLTCPICNNGSRLVATGFVVVCRRGHIEDFPFDVWAHKGEDCKVRAQDALPKLRLVREGARMSMSNLLIKCQDCNAVRGMQDAFATDALSKLHPCIGKRPWLSEDDPVPCHENLQLRPRTSTGVYMPVTISALNIPPWSMRSWSVMSRHLDAMEGKVDSSLRKYISDYILPQLPHQSEDELVSIYKDMLKRNGQPIPASEQELYEEEFKALCVETDDPSADFVSARMTVPTAYASLIKDVFAVHRLTETVAMCGFTRLKSWSGEIEDPIIAPILNQPREWLPAINMHGEGIFIRLNEDAVRRWELNNPAVYRSLLDRLKRSWLHVGNASPAYILLHTLSHLLIRSLSANCGYSAASLKERIYSSWPGENATSMAGILIYTASSDAEGSLGGLVEQSSPESLGAHIDALLEDAGWCSADPLCMNCYSEHGQGTDGLNYAACHQCTLLPETSCAMRNLLLDRAALIGREEDGTRGYFK